MKYLNRLILVLVSLLFLIDKVHADTAGDLSTQNRASFISRDGYNLYLGTEDDDDLIVRQNDVTTFSIDGATGAISFTGTLTPKLTNNTYLTSVDAAGTGTINVLKVDATDDTVLNADTGDSIKFSIAGTEYWGLSSAGALTQNATNGGSLIMGKSGTSIVQGAASIDSDLSGAFGTSNLVIQGASASADQAVIVGNGNAVTGPHLYFTKTRGTGGDANTVVASGDELFSMVGWGADGTSYRAGAKILATVNGTPGASDMPGAIDFQVSPDGSATLASALKIVNDGSLQLANDSSNIRPARLLNIYPQTADGTDNGAILLTGGGSTGSAGRGAEIYVGGNEYSNGIIRLNEGSNLGGIHLQSGYADVLVATSGSVTLGTNVQLNLSASGNTLRQTVATGLTATGTVLGDSLALTSIFNRLTTVAAGTGANLFNSTGVLQCVQNLGANDLKLYPNSASGQINGAAAGTPITVASATRDVACCVVIASNTIMCSVSPGPVT